MTTRAEQETIIQWDEEEQEATLYTAYEPQASHWSRLGYEVAVPSPGPARQPHRLGGHGREGCHAISPGPRRQGHLASGPRPGTVVWRSRTTFGRWRARGRSGTAVWRCHTRAIAHTGDPVT